MKNDVMVKTELNAYSSALNILLCNFSILGLFLKIMSENCYCIVIKKPPDDNYYKLLLNLNVTFVYWLFTLLSKRKVMSLVKNFDLCYFEGS